MEQIFRMPHDFENIVIKFPLVYFNKVGIENLYEHCLQKVYDTFVGDNNDRLDSDGFYIRNTKTALHDVLTLKNLKPFGFKQSIIKIGYNKHHTVDDRIIDTWKTPLHLFLALFNLNSDDDKLLLDLMSIYLTNFPNNINVKDVNDDSPISTIFGRYIGCIQQKQHTSKILNLIIFLIKKGLCVNSPDNNILQLSFVSLSYCDEWCELITILLGQGISINNTDENGNTIGHVCNILYKHNANKTKYLLNNGFDVNIKNKKGNNVLHSLLCDFHIASPHVDYDILDLIIKKISNINDVNNKGKTPMDILFNNKSIKDDDGDLRNGIERMLLANGSHPRKAEPEPEPSFLANIPLIGRWFDSNVSKSDDVALNSVIIV